MRSVLYMAHPVAPYGDRLVGDNVARAMRWLRWLRRSFPETTFIAPWIAALMCGEDDANPAQREAGLVDADAVIELVDGVVLVGGRISSGMEREAKRAKTSNGVVFDLTELGDEPPGPEVERAVFGWVEFAREFQENRR